MQWTNQLMMVSVSLTNDFAPVISVHSFSGDVFVTAGELEARNNAESAVAAGANVGVADNGERPLQKSTLHQSILLYAVCCTCLEL